MRYLDLSAEHKARKRRHDRLIELQYDQRYLSVCFLKTIHQFARLIPEQQLLLGPDIAAAHFLVNRGSAIKFVGDEEWHQMNKDQEYVLPARRIDGEFTYIPAET